MFDQIGNIFPGGAQVLAVVQVKRQRDYIEKIHGAGISLLGIINGILDFSKIEAGKVDIEQIGFNLDTVLINVATVTRGKANDKGLEFMFQISPSMSRILIGDLPMRMRDLARSG